MGIGQMFLVIFILFEIAHNLNASSDAFSGDLALGFEYNTDDYKTNISDNFNRSHNYSTFNRRRAAGTNCMADGTKCQYSSCGRGQLLPNCAVGFAAGVTGGRGGRSYTVTNSGDNPNKPAPGTLRYAVNLASLNQKGVWITFARHMTINLKEMLLLRSDTTIDGRGVRVVITGRAIGLARIQNVILHNLQVNGVDNFDTVHVYGSTRVWVDHLTSFDGKLGLVSVVKGSTDVTISNCFLSNKHFNMLIGAADGDIIDRNLRVTVYRNWFKNSDQRSPHCRLGYCHVMNNLYLNWGDYAIGGRANAKVYSERNVFIAGSTLEVTPWFNGYESQGDTTPTIQSKADLFLNGATFHQFLRFGGITAPPYKLKRDYPPAVSTKRVARLVGRCSGVLLGQRIRSCFLQG